MTKEQIKEQFPEVYQEIYNEGYQAYQREVWGDPDDMFCGQWECGQGTLHDHGEECTCEPYEPSSEELQERTDREYLQMQEDADAQHQHQVEYEAEIKAKARVIGGRREIVPGSMYGSLLNMGYECRTNPDRVIEFLRRYDSITVNHKIKAFVVDAYGNAPCEMPEFVILNDNTDGTGANKDC